VAYDWVKPTYSFAKQES